MDSMFYKFLKRHINNLGLSFTKVSFKTEIPAGRFSEWKKTKRRPSDTDIDKLAGVKELGLDRNTLLAWRLMDEYPEESLKIALKERERRKTL